MEIYHFLNSLIFLCHFSKSNLFQFSSLNHSREFTRKIFLKLFNLTFSPQKFENELSSRKSQNELKLKLGKFLSSVEYFRLFEKIFISFDSLVFQFSWIFPPVFLFTRMSLFSWLLFPDTVDQTWYFISFWEISWSSRNKENCL